MEKEVQQFQSPILVTVYTCMRLSPKETNPFWS